MSNPGKGPPSPNTCGLCGLPSGDKSLFDHTKCKQKHKKKQSQALDRLQRSYDCKFCNELNYVNFYSLVRHVIECLAVRDALPQINRTPSSAPLLYDATLTSIITKMLQDDTPMQSALGLSDASISTGPTSVLLTDSSPSSAAFQQDDQIQSDTEPSLYEAEVKAHAKMKAEVQAKMEVEGELSEDEVDEALCRDVAHQSRITAYKRRPHSAPSGTSAASSSGAENKPSTSREPHPFVESSPPSGQHQSSAGLGNTMPEAQPGGSGTSPAQPVILSSPPSRQQPSAAELQNPRLGAMLDGFGCSNPPPAPPLISSPAPSGQQPSSAELSNPSLDARPVGSNTTLAESPNLSSPPSTQQPSRAVLENPLLNDRLNLPCSRPSQPPRPQPVTFHCNICGPTLGIEGNSRAIADHFTTCFAVNPDLIGRLMPLREHRQAPWPLEEQNGGLFLLCTFCTADKPQFFYHLSEMISHYLTHLFEGQIPELLASVRAAMKREHNQMNDMRRREQERIAELNRNNNKQISVEQALERFRQEERERAERERQRERAMDENQVEGISVGLVEILRNKKADGELESDRRGIRSETVGVDENIENLRIIMETKKAEAKQNAEMERQERNKAKEQKLDEEQKKAEEEEEEEEEKEMKAGEQKEIEEEQEKIEEDQRKDENQRIAGEELGKAEDNQKEDEEKRIKAEEEKQQRAEEDSRQRTSEQSAGSQSPTKRRSERQAAMEQGKRRKVEEAEQKTLEERPVRRSPRKVKSGQTPLEDETSGTVDEGRQQGAAGEASSSGWETPKKRKAKSKPTKSRKRIKSEKESEKMAKNGEEDKNGKDDEENGDEEEVEEEESVEEDELEECKKKKDEDGDDSQKGTGGKGSDIKKTPAKRKRANDSTERREGECKS